MIEKTLVLIKPDAVNDGKSEEIKNFLISKDINIIKEKNVKFEENTLKHFYKHVKSEDFINVSRHFLWGFAIVLILEGENAMSVVKEAKNFLRKKYDYGYYGCTIHSSDSKEAYKRERDILFSNNKKL